MLLCREELMLVDDTDILNKMEKDLNNIGRELNKKKQIITFNKLNDIYDNTLSILLKVASLSMPVFELYDKFIADFEDASFKKENYEIYSKCHEPYNKIKNKSFYLLDKIDYMREIKQKEQYES